jgi:hypothetical protein
MLLLTPDQLEAIEQFRSSNILKLTRSVPENLLTVMARRFVFKQVRKLNKMTLTQLSPNPFLIQLLNLGTPREVVELNIYMYATRSMVTSLGYLIEDLLINSSNNTVKSKKPWDIVKQHADGHRSWLQVKSGPNDMDKDQINLWGPLIAEKLISADESYIGITYGKRSTSTVTMGLFRTYLPDWEKRTLIGRELWDFISEDPAYHEKIFPLLSEAASDILGTDSIESRIQQCVKRVTEEFETKYGTETDAVTKYLADIF